VDWTAATSPDYAFRFLGDDTANADFLALIGATRIDGLDATFKFAVTCSKS
jgi:hypothetical protein